jgi:hypothetical protein
MVNGDFPFPAQATRENYLRLGLPYSREADTVTSETGCPFSYWTGG